MTWPVTPNPGIHQDTQSVKQQKALFTQAQLLKWAEQLPLAMVKDLANAILGALGLTAIEGPLAALVAQVHAALQNIPGENIVGVLTNALQNAFNLFGQIRLAQLPVIPVSHIRNINPELLWNAGFDTAASISTGSGFTWDGTIGHTALGSAKCIPDGVTTFPLLSSPVPVTQGESLTISVWTEWSGLTRSGSNPIQLLAQTYFQGAPVAQVTIASEATPGASSSWVQLTGSYPVPAGVDTVYLMPVVNPTATGGTVWFDDASVTKAGVLTGATGLVDGFATVVDSFVNFFNGTNTSGNPVTGILTAIKNGLSGLIGAVVDNFDGTGTIVSNLLTNNGDGTGTIGALLGTSPLATLVDSADGTGMSPIHILQNIAALTGTHNSILNFLNQSGSSNVLRGMSTDLQALIDNGINALTGGAGSGNHPAQFATALTTIPSANLVAPPNPGTGVITHDANASAAFNSANSTFLTASWTNTTASGANLAIVRLAFYYAGQPTNLNYSVTWGGISMSLVGSVAYSNVYSQVWALFNPPTGAQTVTYNIGVNYGIFLIACAIAESDSYIGVASIGMPVTAVSSSSSPTLTIASSANDYVINFLATYDASSVALSSYSQTSRYHSGTETIPGATSGTFDFIAGDAVGASSVTFSATSSVTSGNAWLGLAMNLAPLSANVIGSGFHVARTSTAAVAATAASEVFPNSFWNAAPTYTTNDISWNSTTGTLTISQAGWYKVDVSCLMASTSTGQALAVGFFQNGALSKSGTQVVYTNIGAPIMQGAWAVYCNVNDTLQAATNCGSTNYTLSGNSTGTATYMTVGLMNRSLM
jgi:hypothetical protein